MKSFQFYRPQPKQITISVENENVTLRRQRFPRQISMISDNSEHNKSFGAWLKSIFTMSDEDILGRCGYDALQYLRFQRHVICYLTVPMVLSISVILPLNFQGRQRESHIYFNSPFNLQICVSNV